MDSSMLALILVGIIGAVSIFGGYRLARMKHSNDKQIRAIARILIVVILLIALLLKLKDFSGTDTPTAPSIPTQIPIQMETLTLNETTTYTLTAGNTVALRYAGELGQVATLTLKPDSGDSPAIVIMRGNPPTAERSIHARGLQTIICGYQWEDNETVTFSFQATATTTYTVEFVDGNTCQGE